MQQLADGNLAAASDTRCRSNDEIGVLFKAVAGYRDALLRSASLAEEADRERQRLYAAVSNMPVGVAMFDTEKRLITCNG